MIRVYKPLFAKRNRRTVVMYGTAPELAAELGCVIHDKFKFDCQKYGRDTALRALEKITKQAIELVDSEGVLSDE